MGVYEIMNIDRDLKDLILKTSNSDEVKDLAIKKGMKTLAMSAKELVLSGQTTIEEMMKIIFADNL